jgi:ADP-heptose:LPS heptosyltransferase
VRTLLIRPGAIGDLIVSLPALEHLRSAFTEVWCAGHNVPLIRFADRVRSIASTSLDLLELDRSPASLIESLRSFDRIVSWYGSARSEFQQALRNTVGDLPIEFLPALPLTDTASPLHATDFYLHQIGAPLGAIPRIPVAAHPRLEIPRQPFAVIHPFSGSRKKNWPLDRFEALADSLSIPVHWLYGPDQAFDGELNATTPKSIIRIDDLYELACWLSCASLYIGNDSGITHLAAAVGTPTIAIFGPTDPHIWAPRGTHVTICTPPSGASWPDLDTVLATRNI